MHSGVPLTHTPRYINGPTRPARTPHLLRKAHLHPPPIRPSRPARPAGRRPGPGAGPGHQLGRQEGGDRLAGGTRGDARDGHPERLHGHLSVRRRGSAEGEEGVRAEGAAGAAGEEVRGCGVGWGEGEVGEGWEFLE